MDIGDLPDKKFRIAVSRNLNEQQESIERQFNKIRKRYINKVKNLTTRNHQNETDRSFGAE